MSATKYRSTPEIDRVIQEAYRLLRVNRDYRALRLCSKRVGWPYWAIRKRGRDLGLVRTKEARWTEPEVEILREYGYLSVEALQVRLGKAGFHRSTTAIREKRNRMRLSSSGEWFSANQLAEAMGVDGHKVTRWINAGLLKAGKRNTDRTPQQGGDIYLIMRRDVMSFLLRCPEEYDLARVEKFWYLDLLTDGRICR